MAPSETYHVSVKYGAAPSNTVVVPAAEPVEFERFERLTSQLLSVPKAELDEKRSESARELPHPGA